MTEDLDALLDRLGTGRDETVLTRRQAEVLVLREREVPQAAIARRFGTTRANIAGIESRARENVAKARRTVDFVEALHAPVTLTIEAGTDVYEIPDRIYRAADAADVKVALSAVSVIERLTDSVHDAIDQRQLTRPVHVTVTVDGDLRIREGVST